MNPIYAIGDIHGQKEMLDHALALIVADGGENAQIVFVGDYTDRGPDSRAVIDTLIAGRNAGRDWVFLKGNHDRLFYRFMDDPCWYDPAMMSELHWLDPRLGGATTLASYGVDDATEDGRIAAHRLAKERVPQAHLDFLEGLPLTHRFGDLFFAHAGVRPGVALADQADVDLIWIRKEFIDDPRDHGALIVHGHTVIDAATHYGNRVNLDGGAAYGRDLVPAVFEGREVWTLTDAGRVPLVPA